ncbi:MAG TPA: DUF3105 domain-containing protein [Pseudonocardiaceae bacterium]
MAPRSVRPVAAAAALFALLAAVTAGCSAQETGQAVPAATPAAGEDTGAGEPSAGSSADPSADAGAEDPSAGIEDIEIVDYPNKSHVTAPDRVAYDQAPPFGGPHDAVWAACNGAVYATAVRNEHMVHSLEHGAVWIAYDPARVTGAALDSLRATVTGQPYLMLSPYPGLDRPISLQSWGHRLKVDSPDDERIAAFVRALRANPATHPEPGATCDVRPDVFDVDNPPPFEDTPPGPDAVPVG